MSRLIILSLGLLLSFSAFAQELAIQGFNKRFELVRDDQGKMTVIKLKKVTSKFSIMPFIEQIKSDLSKEQSEFVGLTEGQKEAEVDNMLYEMGLDPYAKSNGSEEAQRIKESIMNIANINVEDTFRELDKKAFWKEFESRLNEAFLFIDPTILANLEDPRFFYRREVTYQVVKWALEQAKKRFATVPVLNIASFVIVRVHEMMLEQRHFHHNMLLHYFETIPETKLGMTKEEVDRTVSSIFEYRIGATNIFESNRATADWLNYGMNKFYMQVRAGNTRIRNWEGPMTNVNFENVEKLNFAFASVTHQGARKIYHLHHMNHSFSSKPSMAYDYSNPKKVKRNRALLNMAGVALGFIQIPGWIKSSVINFMDSMYVQQVRMEGALVGYFESTGDQAMINQIYSQRANFYIVR
ncbi:MAG: hypothetical protein NDI69_02570 [Bacteriovoracaceae bacterium]|nr:hypothetical protein [Bacteriovoracaceae bacterium]